jgi:colanic acid/amylovoran biosynthesis glycosyltransferase
MRIAFLLTKFPVLSETFILSQITGLLDRGHEVDIFAAKGETHGKMHSDVVKYNLLERTYYRFMPKNKLIRFGHGAGHLINNFPLKALPLLKSLNVSRFRRKALTLSLFYAALPFVDKDPYDIIHCHFGENGNLGVQLRDIGALKGQIVVTFHGHDVTSYPQLHGKDVYENLFKKADLITINSNFIKNRVKGLGCDEDKIIKLPVGLNTSDFLFSKKEPCPQDEIRLLTVGRLVEKKGIEYSIAAVAEVLKIHPNIRYSIAGDGQLRHSLEQLIVELGVGDRVKLVGWKNQDEIRQLYAKSHIFILSSVTANNGDQEGQGLVLQEAQAMGLPVIATLHNGFPDSVIDGKSAFLVPEKKINALAERIKYLVEHPGLWPEMGQAGRKYVEERFDSNKLNDKLVCIYQKLVNENEQLYQDKLISSRSV